MAGIDTALSSFSHLALRSGIRNDDGVDQLHHFVSVSVLVFFAAVTGVVEYAGSPIDCWNYGEYLWQHFQAHVNSFCWTHSLYKYPNSTNHSIMPYALNALGAAEDPKVLDRTETLGEITFFRWVTIIFILQAFCFKLPNLVWSEVNAYSGSNIVKMVEMLQGAMFTKREEKTDKLRQVALFLEQWLRIHRKPHWFLTAKVSPLVKKTLSCCTLCIGNNISNYLSTLYLVTKGLFLLNNVLQFFVLSAFLQLDFWTFGTRILTALRTQPTNKATTDTFPLLSLCHFQTYDINSKATPPSDGATGKWVQCLLNINVFLEKLFLIEWFWLLILLVVTSVSFCIWCFRILQTDTALKFVTRYMRLIGVYAPPPSPIPANRSLEQFVLDYLRNDGVFVLRILAVNTNDVMVAELVELCWERYLEFEEQPHGVATDGPDKGPEAAETSFTDMSDKPPVDPTPPTADDRQAGDA